MVLGYKSKISIRNQPSKFYGLLKRGHYGLKIRSMVEKVAAEAPIKMMFPMILFIFPVIFLLIFAPIVLSFFTGGW